MWLSTYMKRNEATLFLSVLYAVRSTVSYHHHKQCLMTSRTIQQAAFNSNFLQLFPEVLITPRRADA